jgi:hypothetical protein
MYLTFPVFGPVYAADHHKNDVGDWRPILFSVIASMYNLSRLIFSTYIGANL